VNQVGTRHGVKEDLDGILNALQWLRVKQTQYLIQRDL